MNVTILDSAIQYNQGDGSVAVAKGKTRVTVTLDGSLYSTIKKLSDEEGRSLSGQIRYELKKALLTNSRIVKKNGDAE